MLEDWVHYSKTDIFQGAYSLIVSYSSIPLFSIIRSNLLVANKVKISALSQGKDT